MTKVQNRLPILLKEPTGWVLIVLMVGFIYVQWPTRIPQVQAPDYFTQQVSPNLRVTWEEEPSIHSTEPEAWMLERKLMVFMVQKAELKKPFDSFVTEMAEQDRKTVGGAVQEPLIITANSAQYSFFDAENRIQEHRIYLDGNEWVKVSMLYKPSMETRVERAALFLNGIKWQL